MSEKVRKTLTLDNDLVELFAEDDPDSLSGAVNAVLRSESERRARRASLTALVADLDARFGPADPAEVQRARAMLA